MLRRYYSTRTNDDTYLRSFSCDEVDLQGVKKPESEVRHSFVYAQKYRAAATFGFGRVHRLGSQAWTPNSKTGEMEGNPSISGDISRYMCSLRRRKVQGGETAKSARAITHVTFLIVMWHLFL